MDWFILTIVLGCVASSLVLSMRAITPETNPFLFMGYVTLGASSILALYCMVRDVPMLLNSKAFVLAGLAGISVCLLDLTFIFMFRKGATVSVSMQIFRVSSILISAAMGFLVFREMVSPVKMAGMLVACGAVYLLYSKPKGV